MFESIEQLRRNQLENQLLRQRQYQPNPPAQPWLPQGHQQRASVWEELTLHREFKENVA